VASFHIRSKSTSHHDWYISAICIYIFLTFNIVTIIILEYACRFRASSPDSTRTKALDKAYSQYKQSGTHKVLKTQFPGSPNKYSIPQFTEFILQRRLWQLVAIFSPLSVVCPFVLSRWRSVLSWFLNQSSYCSFTDRCEAVVKWPEVREPTRGCGVSFVQLMESCDLRTCKQVVNLVLGSQPPRTIWMRDSCRTGVVISSGETPLIIVTHPGG
jgi:hypothetical protein